MLSLLLGSSAFVLYQSQIHREFTCFHSFAKLLRCPEVEVDGQTHPAWGAWVWAKCHQNTWGLVRKCVTQVQGQYKTVRPVSYPGFCLKIHIPSEGRSWAVYPPGSYLRSFSGLA